MDTSYFAYPRTTPLIGTSHTPLIGGDVPQDCGTEGVKNGRYIIVNLNKNGEQFLPDIAKDVTNYLQKDYTVYYVPVAKGNNTYYNDLQYLTSLQKEGA